MLQSGHAAQERVRADAGELDDGGPAAEDGKVAHRAVTGQHDVVREDDVVADVAVVSDMGIGEESAAVADGVDMPPPSVPGLMVTPSRMRQSEPMVSVEGSPLYLRSCGW